MPQSPYLDYTSDMSPGVKAFLMPLQSRRIELRIFTIPQNKFSITTDGTSQSTVVNPVMELKKAEWQPCPEGEFAGEPFATGTRDKTDNPLAIIQAMVNLGHALGMTPKGAEDRSAEITALRYHLEDMRKLALKGI